MYIFIVADSYSCTEPALDYEGCFMLSITELCAYYGTDGGTGTDSVIQSAPEIDKSHVFGTWRSGSTEPSEPTTEPEPESLQGDVNLDGTVSVNDVVMLQKYLLNVQPFSYDNFIISDMNQDGKVNVFDLILLKKKLLSE